MPSCQCQKSLNRTTYFMYVPPISFDDLVVLCPYLALNIVSNGIFEVEEYNILVGISNSCTLC